MAVRFGWRRGFPRAFPGPGGRTPLGGDYSAEEPRDGTALEKLHVPVIAAPKQLKSRASRLQRRVVTARPRTQWARGTGSIRGDLGIGDQRTRHAHLPLPRGYLKPETRFAVSRLKPEGKEGSLSWSR